MPDTNKMKECAGNGDAGKTAATLGFFATVSLILATFGPGLITGNFGNDAGGIATYSMCGSRYGYKMLWIVIPITLLLLIYQSMSAKMGSATGKGLSELVREQFGVKTSFYLIIAKMFAGVANTTAELAGVAAAVEVLGGNRFFAVPLAVILVWLLTIKTDYKKIEKVFLVGCLFFGTYIISGIMALSANDWKDVGRNIVSPDLTPFLDLDKDYWLLFIAFIGTTIAPWMPFYQQSAVVEKGLKPEQYKYMKWELLGSGISVALVIFFIIITCSAVLHKNGVVIETAEQAAMALAPLAGEHAKLLFAIGLLVASLGAAIILPLSTAFSVCETFGWEASVSKKFADAWQFYSLYTVNLLVGAAIVLIPGINLIKVMLLSQVINGLIVPFVLILMCRLRFNRKLMGDSPGMVYKVAVIAATVMVSLAAAVIVVISII